MDNVYSKLKFLKFRDQLDALENETIAPPVHVRIKPMNPCDHDCWYCAYHVENLQLGNLMEYKDRLPKEKMMEIIDDLVEMGVKAVTFSGGGELDNGMTIAASFELDQGASDTKGEAAATALTLVLSTVIH